MTQATTDWKAPEWAATEWLSKHGGHPALENWHDYILVQFDAAAKGEAPEVYDDADGADLIADVMIGDMPWGDEKYATVAENIEKDPRFSDIREGFIERYGRDFWDDGWREILY